MNAGYLLLYVLISQIRKKLINMVDESCLICNNHMFITSKNFQNVSLNEKDNCHTDEAKKKTLLDCFMELFFANLTYVSFIRR
jgi:hypothetical protein